MKSTTSNYDGGDLSINGFNDGYLRGLKGEEEFLKLISDNKRVEIKYESHQFVMTGNIFIEFQQKTIKTGRWINSGILKDYDTLAYGLHHPILNFPIFIILSRENIIELLKWGKDILDLQIKEKSSDDGTNITKGVLFPLSQLLWSEELRKEYTKQKDKENTKRLKEIFNNIKKKK
jgi:hypothetical protein